MFFWPILWGWLGMPKRPKTMEHEKHIQNPMVAASVFFFVGQLLSSPIPSQLWAPFLSLQRWWWNPQASSWWLRMVKTCVFTIAEQKLRTCSGLIFPAARSVLVEGWRWRINVLGLCIFARMRDVMLGDLLLHLHMWDATLGDLLLMSHCWCADCDESIGTHSKKSCKPAWIWSSDIPGYHEGPWLVVDQMTEHILSPGRNEIHVQAPETNSANWIGLHPLPWGARNF